jgi:D-amino-acid dehydrogenase
VQGAPENLLFNAGHGALGFTLAAGSAQRVSHLLQGAVGGPRGLENRTPAGLSRSAAGLAAHSA